MPPKEFRRARLRARLATLLVATLAIFGLSVVSGVSTPAANAAAGTISNASCSSAVGEATTASITTVSGTDCVVTFTSGTNSWTVPLGVTSVSILVVAGGGAGGNRAGGGGGAGGYVYRTGVGTTPGGTISLTVGGGGAAGTSGSTTQGNSGSDSVFSLSTEVRAKGGGGGGTGNGNSGTYAGVAGGSSGGSDGYNNAGSSNTPGSSTQGALGYGQGNSGALGTNGNNSVNWSGGGGGGAGGAGSAATSGSPAVTGLSSSSITNGGAGGAGVSNSITGSAVCYAAGGGGGIEGTSTGSVGAGGACSGVTSGGAGAKGSGTAGSGVANTGSGGGGSGFNDSISSNGTPGAGSAGVVVVRWVNPVLTSATATGTNAASCNQTGSNLGVSSSDVTVVGLATGYCIITFTNPKVAYSWTVPTGVTNARVLIVGGGGAGGGGVGGGGGAGEFVELASSALTAGNAVSIQVGSGGASNSWAAGGAGSSSKFGTTTAYGGGGGGTNTANPAVSSGGPGFGSQGGTDPERTSLNAVATRSDGVTGFRNSGGAGSGGGSGDYTAGGGGGAGAVGGNGTTASGSPAQSGGAGGAGKTSDITGTSTYYAGGGGGGVNGAASTANGSTPSSSGSPGAGGVGGGGVAGAKANAASVGNYGNRGDGTNGTVNANGTTGSANTGGGGGGASNWVYGGAGGSGLVVVSYELPPTISSISPTSGPSYGTTAITITGTNFLGATGVTIGGTAATNVTVASQTSITATVPAGTNGAKDVVVTTPGGSATLTSSFTYSTSTSVTATGSNASACNQTGTNLGNGTTDVTAVGLSTGYCVVTFSNPAAAYAWTVPTGVTSASVLVVGGGGGGAASQATYQSSGGGGGGGGVYPATSVPVTAGSSISISVGAGGAGGTSSSTQANTVGARGGASAFGTLTAGGGGGGGCNTNAGAGACPQTNTQSGGNGTAAGNGGGATNFWAAYAYGAAGTATSVTIGGTTFSARAGYNGGSYGGTTYTSAAGGGAGGAGTSSSVGPGVSSSITGTSTTYGVGGGAYGVTGWSFGAATGIGTGGSGVYSSTGTALNGASGTNGVVVVSYPMPAPTITSITPAYGVPAGSTTVTLTGTNLTGTTGVTVGGTTATGVTVVSPTSLTFVTPAGTSGAKNVVVTTPGGSATLSAAFTYGASSVSATGTNASYCAQTGNNLGNGTTDVTAVATSNGYCVVTFTNPTVAYQWNVPTGVTSVRTVVVGGGAGGDRGVGAYFWGHGGGGGQVVDTTATVSGGTAVSIAVGAAGTAGIGTATWASTTTVTPTTTGAGNGGSSSFGSTTAAGGQAASLISPSGGTSGSGKVGGVGSGSMSAGGCGNLCGAGGGGGAGAAGSGLNGGAGVFSDITGTSTEYGAGGAGRNNNVFGTAGGGASVGADALANRGGGGSDSGGANGTNGGSGVVIVSYPLPPTVGTASIAGTTQVGSTLTASTTAVAPTSTTYQWLSATTAAGTYSDISGATSSTYTLASTDFNTYLKVVMTITNASGTVAETSTATAVVTAGAPTVTAVSPQSGTTAGGTSVTITGTNFLGVTGVKFGTLAASSYTVVSATSITATSPAASASTVDITVTNATNTSSTSSADKFSYTVTAATATGTNASACNQAGTNLGNGTTDVTAVGTAAGYCVVTFKTPSVGFGWTVPTGVTTVSVLTVGGGGGAGAGTNGTSGPAGGGGGGGVTANTAVTVTPGNTISISVGAGGAGATAIAAPIASQNGGSTSFGSTVTALGGGGGAGYGFATGTQTGVATGGGGGGNGSASCSGSTPTGTTYLGATVSGGLNGGYGVWGWGGGGGGAGGAATPGSCSSSNSGTPGVGVSNSITGTPVTYGQGGYSNYSAATTAGVATVPANTGFGGNAAYSGGASNGSGSAGANGVLIVSYGMFVSYTYNANNGTGSSPAGGSVQGGTSFSTAANPYSRDGYTFTGWNTAANGSGTALTANASNTMPASATALVFYAQWTANSNTVTFNSQGGSTVSSTSWSTGSALTLPAAPTRPGYTFDGWYDSASGGSRVIKNALSFDGVNDRITIPHSTAFNFTNAMTIEAWINTTGANQYITTKGDDSFYLMIGTGGTLDAWLNGAYAHWLHSSIVVNDGVWHHIAVTYNGSYLKIIIDGVERASVACSGDITSGTTAVEVGYRTNSSGLDYSGAFAGKIYDLRYWNIARSATDIASTMNTELAGTESGLVAAYLLNQGSPSGTNPSVTTATNSKSGSSSGTLLNFALSGTSSNWVSRSASYTPANTSAFTLFAQWVALSTDATLSGLALSVGTLSPTFASATTSYTASVSNATTSLTVTPTVNQANATVQVKIGAGSYASVTSGSASSALTLAAGANTITVLVTAQDGSTTQSYTITVNRLALPVISSISPTTGPIAGGTSVVITGTGFTGATAVKFGTTNATTFIVNSDTQTTVTSPAIAASTVDITITTPAGTSTTSTADQFRYSATPTITSLSVTTGPLSAGTSTVINGTNLLGTTAVTVGGVSATLGTITSTTIALTLPVGTAGAKDVVLSNPNGNVTVTGGYTYVTAPTVTSLASSVTLGLSGVVGGPLAGGTTVTVTGSALTGTSGVTVGGVAATNVTVVSDTSVTFVTPAGSSNLAYNVVLTTAGGSATKTNGFTYVSAVSCGTSGSFNVGNNEVTNANNCQGSVAVPSGVITIDGCAFANAGGGNCGALTGNALTDVTIAASVVTISGLSFLNCGITSFTFATGSGLKTIGNSAFYLSGQFAITIPASVTNIDNAFYKSNVNSVTFATPSSLTSIGASTFRGNPYLTSLVIPSSVTTIGNLAFSGSAMTQITFNGNITSFYNSSVFNSPPLVCIVNPNNYAYINNFAYAAPSPVVVTSASLCGTPPTITSLSPSTGSISGGTAVTLTGTNLAGVNAVWVNGVSATSVVAVSATSVTFVTPANAVGTYAVWVDGANGPGIKASAFVYTNVPTVTSLSTSTGTTAGGTSITITGSNFTGATAVKFGTTAATSFTVVSSTSITAVTPALAAGTVDVTVTTANGTSATSSADQFTFVTAPTIASASITGTAQVGSTLTAVPGTITGSSVTTSYQWQSAATSGGTYSNISLATSSTYTAVSADAGNFIKVVITVTNTGGTASQTSSATTAILLTAPTLSSATISGTAQVGSTLTATPGTTTGTSTTTTYQWQSSTLSAGTYTNIASATSSTYTAVAADAGNFIKVVITVTNNGGSAVQTSAATAAVTLASALTPTFGAATLTADGFTVQITNYNTSYAWTGTATASGVVTVSGTGLVAVTGVAPGTSSTATIKSTRAGFADGTAQTSATSIAGSAYSPSFSAITSTSDGFTVRITNFDSTYTWPTPTVSAGSISVGTPVGGIETLTVTGLTPTSSALITQTVTRTGYNSGSGTVTGSALIGAALVPTFSSVTQTSTGFTVSVTNYNAIFTWATPTTTAGTVTVGTPSGSTRLITVSGLNPGSSATLTVTTSRTSYTGGSASINGSSNLSSDKTLSSLVISSGTLSPVFSSSTSNYNVTVANSVSSITITPTVNQINASVEAKIGSGTNSLLTSGAASGALSLAIGSNTLTITVTAQDLTTGTYVLTVTRSASADATLSALTISSGTLSPIFSSLTTAYAVSLANSVSTLTVTPTANQAYATIQAKVGSGSYSTVYSGTATSSLNLAVGANTITILVTAQDGSTTNTYSVIATRAPPSHGVTYNLGNGSGTLPTQPAIAEGSTFTLAASTGLTYAGYTFNKWNDGTANYSAGATYTMSTSNVVLTATWTPTSQTVTYLAGTGGSGTAPIQAAVATAATFTTASNTFTRTGYNFAGWYDGTNTYLASATYTMGISNVTLTATWTPQVYTVTYDANGASGSASRTTDSYTYGTSAINLPTVGTMALTGYTFGGWSTSGNTPAISGAYTPAASVTLKAIWTPNVYTVSFSINGATGTTPTSINYTVGTTAIALSNGSGLSYPGYRFDGWATTTGGSSVGTTYTPTASITLQAIWTAIDYTISYSLNGGTSAQPSSSTKTVGTTFTVEAAPTQSGYVFAGWSYNSNTYSSGSTFTVGTSNVAFTAVWIPLYTVHYVMNGSLTSAPVDQLQPSGTSITLEAAPTRVGYTFGGWRDQAGTTRSALASFTVAADSTLTAVWSAIPYTVTYTLTPAPGTAPSQFTVTIGSVFTLASTPVWAGYSFLGWNDGTTNYGGGSSYLVGTQNIAFVAQWSANDFTLDYDVNGASSSVPVSLVKNVSQTFQLPAAPSKAGWIFDNWSDGTATYSAGAIYTMPASNVILTANYHAPAPTITSLSATSGSVLGGTAITLTGTNFTLATAVTVGGAAAVFVINSDTSISIITPAGSNGSANIVLTATGGSATKSGFSYSLLSQSPVALTTTSGTAGTAISLVATGGSGTGSVSFMTITSGCSTVDISGTTYLNAAHPVTCVVAATKAADSTYASSTTVFNVPFVKIASTVALALPSNAIFASYNFTISLSAATNTPGSVTFSDDGTRIGSCNNVATSSNVASCLWTPTDIKTGKVLTALFTPTNTTDYETSTATVLVNVVASSLSGLNPADLYQLGSLSALSNGANSQTFTTTDTTLVLTVPANALPSGSTVHLLIDTNGSSLQTIIGTGGYLLNSIVAWNAPDGSVPAASVPISLAITNSSIRKGMVIYGILNGVTTPLGKASTNGSVTVYLSQDPVIVIAPTKPDAPTSVLASNGQNQSSVVSWLAPSNDGGQTITQYTVTASGAGGQSCTTSNLSCTVSGLANGTSYTFTVTATNAVGTSDPSSQSPSVTPVGPPTIITPTTGLTAAYGSSYTLQIVASGSAQIQSYAVHSGSLPSGLSLNSVSGLITGTPSAAGTYSGISISATDANLQSSNTSLFAIVVNPESVTATLSISPTTVASNGTSYTATITPSLTLSGSSSGAITYAISGGTATNCVITGTTTLTLTANTSGTCSFTATQAADSNYAAVTTAPVTFTFTKAIPAPIVITTTSGQVNTPLTIVTSGGSGTGTDTFTTSGTGCSISGSTLTATQLGTCAVTVSNPGDVYYSSESTTATISIGQITLNVPTSISTSSSAGTTVSVTFTGDSNGTTNLIIYTDGTTTTALRTITGYTSGTPVTGLTPGTTYYVSLISIGTGNYANSAATSRQTVTTLAQAATPSVSIAPSSSSLTLGQSISFVATANVSDGGTLTYRWSFGGVTIDSATASTYTFTPSQTSQAGVYTVTVSNSKNGTQTTATATASLSISGALSISTPSTGLTGTVGTALTPISAPAGGGAGTLTYAVTTGLTQLTALGLGLDSSTATAQVIGTPVVAGTATIVITVTDANSQSVSTSAFTITIGAAAQNLAFTLSASTAASTGTSFEARLTPTLTLAGAGTGAVTYSLIGGTATGCQILNSSTIETITATTAGTCQIVATKAADANYLSATSSTLTFTFTRAAQTPLVITSSRTGTLAAPLTLTTSGGSGSGVATFAVTGTNCVLSGSSLSATAATACDVIATKQADTYYETATSTTVNVNFGLASLNAPVITTVNPNGSTTSLTVAYTADSHGTSVTLNVYAASTDTSPAKSVTNFVSGNAVSGLTAGTTYYIGLSSVGNATYANSAESTRAPGATLVGAIAPVIDTQTVASSLNLTVGQIETLTVTAHSTDGGTLSYQWNFGGNAIPGATSNTYVFTVTSILQSGNYSVTVTEALNGTLASTMSNNVAIAVAGPIAVATPSAGLSATIGFAYSLQIVAAGGTSPLTYRVATGAADLAAAGFSLNAQTGLISGLTAETGTVTVSITVTDAVNSSATTSLFTITLLDDPDAPIPTFSAPVSTNGGFTVIVTNYDATFTESAMVSVGTITNSIPNGSSWLLTVTGLTPGQSATITVTTTRVGYVSGTATVTGTASNSLPPITYTPYLGQGVAASVPVGYTVIQSNLAQVLHATLTVNLTTVRSLVTFAPMSSPVPSWQTPFVITGAIQVVDIYPTGLTGKIQVCLDGTSSDRLWHFINGSWVDITDSHTDTQVCGFTTTFSPFGVGVPVPVVPLPSIFVVKSPVKISLSGNTFTFTAATLEFSYHGAQLQPAVLVDQEINLMADGKVIRNLRLIAPTATITLDKVERGVVYTFQEIVSQADATDAFTSHNTTIEYGISLHDRIVRQNLEKQYFVALNKALQVYIKATNALSAERLIRPKKPLSYFAEMTLKIQAQRRTSQAEAAAARQQGLRDLQLRDYVELRAAGVSIFLP